MTRKICGAEWRGLKCGRAQHDSPEHYDAVRGLTFKACVPRVVHEFDNPHETPSGKNTGETSRVCVVEEAGQFRFTSRDQNGDLEPGKLLLSSGAAAEIARLVEKLQLVRDTAEVGS